jgi:hypothetical protein
MRSHRVSILLVPASLVFFSLFRAPLRADLDDEIGVATDLGVKFLLKAIEGKQAETGEHDDFEKGKIALETYALIVAGVSVDHPIVQKNFETLGRMGLDQTYTCACYAFALDAAISQLQNDAALAAPSQKFRDDPSLGANYRQRLEATVNALVSLRRQGKGNWDYKKGHERFDNSNSQFAVLGLGVGAKRKISIPRDVWEEVAQHWMTCQKKQGPEVTQRPEFYPEDEKGEGKRDRVNIVDKKTGEKVEKGKKPQEKAREEKKGSPTAARPADPKAAAAGPEDQKYFSRGWDYDNKQGETWNMTCGGTSSMILVEDNLRGQVAPDYLAQVKKSIRDGYAWLMQNWNPAAGGDWKYYGLYSLEKVADLGEVKKFGAHDWYHEVARLILDEQRVDGSWPGGNPTQIRWNTSFALLILNRATSLITQGRSLGARSAALTGSVRRDKESSDDRNWVYLPQYDREFHLPSMLRQVRLRPTQKLLKILETALKVYPEDQKGFLVANLVRTREEVKQKPVRDFFDNQLLQITGQKYDSPEKYEVWCRRWMQVQKIGAEAQDPDGLLKVCYSHTSSQPLKKKVIWAIGRCRNQELAPHLLEDLSHGDPEIRQAAYEVLSLLRLSKEPIPAFDHRGEAAARDQQASLIKQWFAKVKSS